MGRTSYKEQQEIVHAESKIEEGVVREKLASSQPQENLDVATTLDQTEEAKSDNKLTKNEKQDNGDVIAAATEVSNGNNEDSSAEQVPRVVDQGDSCIVISKEQRDENVTDADDTEVTVHSESDVQHSVADKDDNSSEVVLVKNTTQDEIDLTVIQTIETTFDQDIGENEKPCTNEKSESEEKEVPKSAIITCNAAGATVENSENQLDAVGEVSCDPLPCEASDPHPCVSSNAMVLGQGQVSQNKLQVVDDLNQTNNNLDEDALKQTLTDENVVEINNERSSDEHKNKFSETTSPSPQYGHTSSEATCMEESLPHIDAQEKNSESALSCASPQQQTAASDNDKSIVASPSGERNELQLKDSGSLEVTDGAAIESIPFRDICAENRLIAALRLSCKLSPGHLVKDLDTKGVMSIHLMRSLSPGVVTVAELVRKLVYLTELDLSGNLLGPQGFRIICLALRRNKTLKCLNLANNLADTDSSVSTRHSLK